jgi:hypothetical protein
MRPASVYASSQFAWKSCWAPNLAAGERGSYLRIPTGNLPPITGRGSGQNGTVDASAKAGVRELILTGTIWGVRSMCKANEYYARAAQCKIRAAETTDAYFKREFERLTQQWYDLAVQRKSMRSVWNKPPRHTVAVLARWSCDPETIEPNDD